MLEKIRNLAHLLNMSISELKNIVIEEGEGFTEYDPPNLDNIDDTPAHRCQLYNLALAYRSKMITEIDDARMILGTDTPVELRGHDFQTDI